MREEHASWCRIAAPVCSLYYSLLLFMVLVIILYGLWATCLFSSFAPAFPCNLLAKKFISYRSLFAPKGFAVQSGSPFIFRS